MLEILKAIFDAGFVGQILGVVGLVVLDLILGVAIALQTKKFDWAKLADFMLTSIAPKLLAWAGFTVLLRLATIYGNVVISSYITSALVTGSWGAIMVSMVGDLVAKGKVIFGDQLPSPSDIPH